MKILIFTEGTILRHSSGIIPNKGKVDWQKFLKKDPSIHNYASYVPIKNATEKITTWKKQGAKILYLTSRRKPNEIKQIQKVLDRYNFPKGKLLFRKESENYKDVAEKIIPNILIEDDCETLGGVDEMTITHIKPEIRRKIKSIVTKDCREGINHLPDKLEDLKSYEHRNH